MVRVEKPELYDLASDPDQLDNLAGRPEVADVEQELSRRLAVLATCAANTCE